MPSKTKKNTKHQKQKNNNNIKKKKTLKRKSKKYELKKQHSNKKRTSQDKTITHKYDDIPDKINKIKSINIDELEYHKGKSTEQDKITTCKEKQYKFYKLFTLPKTEKYYKDIDSNKQISAVYNYSIHYDTVYINKLMALLLKHFAPRNYNSIYKLISTNKSDSEIFKELRKLKRWYPNVYGLTCNKNYLITEKIIKYLKVNKHKINTYLDVGCGNCKFTKILGKSLKLSENDIYGIDPDNYAEQDDWKRDTKGMTFKRVLDNEEYPFEDNKFYLITLNMVLHHVKDLEFLIKEITRVLKKNGILFITDHDAFTHIDKMLVDIEHQLYTEVFNYKPNDKDTKYSDKQGYLKYYNWLEFDKIIERDGLKWVDGDLINLNVRANDLNSTRTFFSIYKKV